MFSFFKASRFLLKGKYRVIATLLANILPCTDSLEIGRALNHKGGEVSLYRVLPDHCLPGHSLNSIF